MMEEKGIVSKANHVGKRSSSKYFYFFIFVSANYLLMKRSDYKSINNLKTLNSPSLLTIKREGNCFLEFPGKLKCDYFDDKKKELIINNKKLAITQKDDRFIIILFQIFMNILYKDKLFEIIKSENGSNEKLINHLF